VGVHSEPPSSSKSWTVYPDELASDGLLPPRRDRGNGGDRSNNGTVQIIVSGILKRGPSTHSLRSFARDDVESEGSEILIEVLE
jgi:hypothetical protein